MTTLTTQLHARRRKRGSGSSKAIRRSPATATSEGFDKFDDPDYRHTYFEARLKSYLATQIRALRGNDNQTEFGKKIGKPQSVVSRIENERYGAVNLQTLIDIAKSLDIALVVQFTDWPTFLRMETDYADHKLTPFVYAPSSKAADTRHEPAPQMTGSAPASPNVEGPTAPPPLEPQEPPNAESQRAIQGTSQPPAGSRMDSFGPI